MRVVIILILVLVFAVIISICKPKTKGAIGERKVNKKLQGIRGYELLKDIMLPIENGTTQIDHILIGEKGIFVIETKNYDGWVYGDERAHYWTQILYKAKNKFYNPIKQNYAHVKAVERLLPSRYKNMIYSVVVFGDSCKLKKIDASTPVINIREIKRFIRRFNTDSRLTEENISYIYEVLKTRNITNKRSRKNHIIRLKIKNNKTYVVFCIFLILIATISLLGIIDGIINNNKNYMDYIVLVVISLVSAKIWKRKICR